MVPARHALATPTTAEPVPGGLRFVVLTDTHADVDVPTNLDGLRRVFAAVEQEDPRFVMNCGDITEYGHDTEYAAYRACIPDGLADRVRHVPGNHEVRWDPTALESYERWFGAPTYSFDVDGIHVVGLDPTQVLQEPGLYGPDDLRWLRRDLTRAGARTPTLLFQHYPIGGRNFFVNDADELLEAIEPFSVRAVFAGHVHREESTHLNGLTQLTGRATKNNPMYYVVERAVGGAGEDALAVTRVTLPPAATPVAPAVREPVGLIVLGRRGPGETLGPVDARARWVPSTGAFSVSVSARRAASSVAARIFPQGRFGGVDDSPWTPLSLARGRWTGALDAAALADGVHRVQVRAEDGAGAGFEVVPRVDKDAGVDRARTIWEQQPGGRVQGALAERDGLVVAGSTNGTVTAWQVEAAAARRRWRSEVGPVYRGAAFSADGTRVHVASADHHLHALDARTGRRLWATDLRSPALSAPLVTSVDDREVVVCAAGDRLVLLERDGLVRWDVEIPVMSAGRPACDGERVYAGAGDGRAYAYDARTGARLWSFATTTRTTAYTRLIYGPWDDVVELLPDGGVLVSTVTGAWALDGASGTVRWQRPGGYLYPSGVLVEGVGMLLVDEFGLAALLDPATGTAAWTVQTAPRVLNAGPVVGPDGAQALVVGTGGLLVRIDLATGSAEQLRQLFVANTFSTPVLVGDQLVVGAQDGVVRGVGPVTGPNPA